MNDEHERTDGAEHEARTQLMSSAGVLATLGIVSLAGLFVLFSSVAETDVPTSPMLAEAGVHAAVVDGDSALRHLSGVTQSSLVLSRTRVRDTVYTTDSVYLEINLTRQNVTVHRRDGTSRQFLISSGTPYIRDGMLTPKGLFTVQNKVPMALSRQFNNARLHHWIGIQGGVGFHGLDGSGYYGYLGKRPSSHGCVRMSREEIREMYSMVGPGAMILSHYGDPARVVAFCDPSDTVGAQLIDSAAVYDRNLGTERLEMFYNGEYWTRPVPRLVHVAGQRLRWGLQIGDADRIAEQQLPSRSAYARYASLTPVSSGDRLDASGVLRMTPVVADASNGTEVADGR